MTDHHVLDVQYDRGGPRLTIYLAGELDAGTAPDFAAEAQQQIDETVEFVCLDASSLDFCDSGGLRAFCEIAAHASAHDAQLVLFEPSEILRRLLEITGLDATLTVQGRPSASPRPKDLAE